MAAWAKLCQKAASFATACAGSQRLRRRGLLALEGQILVWDTTAKRTTGPIVVVKVSEAIDVLAEPIEAVRQVMAGIGLASPWALRVRPSAIA